MTAQPGPQPESPQDRQPGSQRLLAMDIGGSTIAAAPVTLGLGTPQLGTIRTVPTGAEDGGDAVLHRVVRLAEEMIDEAASPSRPAITGVGIASAGVIDSSRGAVVSATSLMPGWAGTELAAVVGAALGLPVSVLNDVHAHGYGEWAHGAGAGAESMLLVAVGTGLGGAVIEGSRLLTGSRGLAGHLGHMHHAAATVMRCSCGREGHVESVASGSGLAAWYARRRRSGEPDADPEAASGADVAALAEAGHPTAQAVLRDSAAALGEILGSAANAVDPARVVVTGSVAQAGGMWWQALRTGFARVVMDPLRGIVPQPGELGAAAPLIGAAVYAAAGAEGRGTPDEQHQQQAQKQAHSAPGNSTGGAEHVSSR